MVLISKPIWSAIIFVSTYCLVSYAGEPINKHGQILFQTEQEQTQNPSPQEPSPSEPNSDIEAEENGKMSTESF